MKGFTEISLRIGETLFTCELVGEDHDANTLLEAFGSLMIGQTFLPRTVYKAMYEIGEEKLELEKAQCKLLQ